MKAVGTRCIIKPKVIERDTGGIHIPESSQVGKDVELYIFDVGPEVDNKNLKKGVRVVIEQRKALPIKVKDTEYFVIEAKDILVIL